MTELSRDIIIGSYSGGKEAPAVFHFKAKEKKADAIVTEINPSFIHYHDNHFYIVTEHQKGLIVVINSQHKIISRIESLGDDPCHISMDNSGAFLVVTNYTSGSILITKLENHKPVLVHSFITHEGFSSHPERQTSPHPHCSVFSEDNSVMFVADLGTDIIYYYQFTPEKVVWRKEKSLKLQNTGPRNLVRGRPGSKLLYMSCELDNTVRILTYKNDKIEHLVAYKVSPNAENFLSQVRYFGGKVFVALRGDNKIMIFKQKQETLEIDFSFKVGKYPRHFAISEEGLFFVACQHDNVVQKYHLTEEKILLLSEIEIQNPSCIVIY